MKIGFARRGYSSTGGAEAFLKRFAAAAHTASHDVVLFGTSNWPREAWPGGEVVPLDGRSPRFFADALMDVAGDCDLLFSLERVWSCDIYRAGDGVHRAWLNRRKAAEPFWKTWGRVVNGKHREILELEESLFSSEGAGCIIANSRMVRDEIIACYGYPAERVHVIYNGVPQANQASQASQAIEAAGREAAETQGQRAKLRAEVRASLGLGPEEYVVLFAGSGWERKGLRFAIEGMRKLKSPATLVVVGRGSRRFLPSSEKVRFAGSVSNMEAYYAAADAFILPTLYDPFSNACLEALAAGLPVITSAANGFSEIIKPGEEGEVLADPMDSGAISRAIEAWRDPARRAAIRPQLLSLAAQYTIEANLKASLALVSGGRSGSRGGPGKKRDSSPDTAIAQAS